MATHEEFYLRYYVGHKGKFGHEFLEFEFKPDGKLRYANNSNYKNDTMIRKEAHVSQLVLDELKRIIEDSEIMQEELFGPVVVVNPIDSEAEAIAQTHGSGCRAAGNAFLHEH